MSNQEEKCHWCGKEMPTGFSCSMNCKFLEKPTITEPNQEEKHLRKRDGKYSTNGFNWYPTISEADKPNQDMITRFYRQTEKLLNDFRNNRIGYEKFIETQENFLLEERKKAYEEGFDEGLNKKYFAERNGYMVSKKEILDKIEGMSIPIPLEGEDPQIHLKSIGYNTALEDIKINPT